jgi:GT2 family glycosyltransferase
VSEFAPIALFVYNRPVHTRRTLEALARNPEANRSHLYIFSDGPKADASQADLEAIEEVRRIIRERDWCGEVSIAEADRNYGLAQSIRGGVTKVVNQWGRIIVLEDDIETSPGFLDYMNRALEVYNKDAQVMHIGAYVPRSGCPLPLPSTFFTPFMGPPGSEHGGRPYGIRRSI